MLWPNTAGCRPLGGNKPIPGTPRGRRGASEVDAAGHRSLSEFSVHRAANSENLAGSRGTPRIGQGKAGRKARLSLWDDRGLPRRPGRKRPRCGKEWRCSRARFRQHRNRAGHIHSASVRWRLDIHDPPLRSVNRPSPVPRSALERYLDARPAPTIQARPGGLTGMGSGLKSRGSQERAGSSPAPGTRHARPEPK
jgi:hypothetical protein